MLSYIITIPILMPLMDPTEDVTSQHSFRYTQAQRGPWHEPASRTESCFCYCMRNMQYPITDWHTRVTKNFNTIRCLSLSLTHLKRMCTHHLALKPKWPKRMRWHAIRQLTRKLSPPTAYLQLNLPGNAAFKVHTQSVRKTQCCGPHWTITGTAGEWHREHGSAEDVLRMNVHGGRLRMASQHGAHQVRAEAKSARSCTGKYLRAIRHPGISFRHFSPRCSRRLSASRCSLPPESRLAKKLTGGSSSYKERGRIITGIRLRIQIAQVPLQT